MFANLFGKKKETMSPQKKQELESKRADLAVRMSSQQFDEKIAVNEKKMAMLEAQISEKTKVSSADGVRV